MNLAPSRETNSVWINESQLDEANGRRHGRMMATLSIRIDFEPEGMLGPGMVELLERVGSHGSIRQAAVSMGMSYRKAWLLIRGMEETFGGEVVSTATGGADGGGADLTPLGHKLIEAYRKVEAGAASTAAGELKALSTLVRAAQRSR